MTTNIQRVLVVGAGQMGQQIAMLCALGGYSTVIQDVQVEALHQAEKSLRKRMNQWVEGGKLTAVKREAAFKKLTFTDNLEEATTAK